MWSTVVAERLGIIDHDEAVDPAGRRPSATLETMERHEPSGQYYNWYDHTTRREAHRLAADRRPDRSRSCRPSTTAGWRPGSTSSSNAVPEVADARWRPVRQHGLRLLLPAGASTGSRSTSRPSTGASPCCYDTIVSESRIASYIGIAKGELPAKEYFGAVADVPRHLRLELAGDEAARRHRTTYLGVNVFEGAYPYEDFRVVPGWGGSMFEALMPALFVPEEKWAPRSWAVNHPLTVAAQIHHGLVEAEYGYWGFSPANIPEGGYTEYGVDAIGMDPDGYKSNKDNTLVDRGFAGCPGREPQPDPPPSAYTNGVVTPHAAFLALRWAPDARDGEPRQPEADFDIYDRWGFRDSVNVDTGVVSDAYLSLDQGIIMAAIGNALADDILRDAFATKEVRKALQPIIGHGDVQRRATRDRPAVTSDVSAVQPVDRRRPGRRARIAWFETLGAPTERDRPAPDVALPPPDRGPRRARPRPGDGVLVTGRRRGRLPRPSRLVGRRAPRGDRPQAAATCSPSPTGRTSTRPPGVEGDHVYAVASLSTIDAPGRAGCRRRSGPRADPARAAERRASPSMPARRRARSSGRGGR